MLGRSLTSTGILQARELEPLELWSTEFRIWNNRRHLCSCKKCEWYKNDIGNICKGKTLFQWMCFSYLEHQFKPFRYHYIYDISYSYVFVCSGWFATCWFLCQTTCNGRCTNGFRGKLISHLELICCRKLGFLSSSVFVMGKGKLA